MTESWRTKIRVHPACAMFPLMSDAELEELAADIDRNGLIHPIELWFAEKPKKTMSGVVPLITWLRDGQLISGQNRIEAQWRATPEDERSALIETLIEKAKVIWGRDPYDYSMADNFHRRHLTAEKKREIIAEYLKAHPERSDRFVAKIAQVDHKTVATVRAEAEGRGEIPHAATRTDSAGREQPARKPRRESKPRMSRTGRAVYAQLAAGALGRNDAVDKFATLLSRELPETLDDLTRLLRDQRHRIIELPLIKRVVLARGYLHALDVSLSDLEPVEDVTDAPLPPRPPLH